MALTNDQLLALILENKTAIANLDGTSGGSSSSSTSSEVDSEWSRISTLLANYLNNNEVYAEAITGQTITASNAWAKYLEALNVVVTQLDADVAEIDALNANEVNAMIGTYLDLHADTLWADYIKTTDIAAENLTVTQLFARVGEFLSLVTNTITAAGVQAFTITSDHLVISDAYITNAMIQSINASKITAGTIDTALVTISGDDSKMLIADGTITISDGTNVRVQIGKDGNNDYNLVVADSSGNVMWSALGLQAAAIKSAIITDSHISSDANISASKINVASLITTLEADGGIKTDASNVIVDLDNQNLSTWFNTMETWKTNVGTTVSNLTTSLSVLQGQVTSLVEDSTIETVQGGLEQLEDDFAELQQTVSGLTSTVSSHTSTINTLNNTVVSDTARISTLEQDVDSLEATVSSQGTTLTSLGTRTTTLESRVTINENSISSVQSKTILDTNDYTSSLTNLQTQINSVAGQISVEVSEALDEAGIDPDEYVTHTEQAQYLTYDTDGLHLGASDTEVALNISPDGIIFTDAEDNELASWDSEQLHTPNLMVDVGKYAQFGTFAFVPRGDGSLAFIRRTSGS